MLVNGKVEKIDKEFLIKQNEELARDGYRVIALASGKIENFEEKVFIMQMIFQNLHLLDLLVLLIQ